jgi:hypothetical protein
MLWRWFNRRDTRLAGERFRAEHSRWLTHAMLSGKRYPRIPTRKVSQGGFDAMMSRPDGPHTAERWWIAAFQRVDDTR